MQKEKVIELLKNSDVGWRFFNQNQVIVDEDSLGKIFINNKNDSIRKWTEITKSKKGHLFRLPDSFWNDLNKISTLFVEWNEINYPISLSPFLEANDKIILFWGSNCSITTFGDVFLKYWTDFCYPDDDNILIAVSAKNVLITYVEENFAFYNKKSQMRLITSGSTSYKG